MQHLAKIPFPEVERLVRSGKALIILPVGVVEEHGAHLPLGLDSFAAEAYAAAAALHLEEKGYEIIIAPTINYGVAHQALSFPGTLSLQPETLKSLVVDIGRSLAKHGLNRMVVLNGHRDTGHMKALDEARSILIEEKTPPGSLYWFYQRSGGDGGLLPRRGQQALSQSQTGSRRPRRRIRDLGSA